MVKLFSEDGRKWSCPCVCPQASQVSVLDGSKAALEAQFVQFCKAVDLFSLCFKKLLLSIPVKVLY